MGEKLKGAVRKLFGSFRFKQALTLSLFAVLPLILMSVFLMDYFNGVTTDQIKAKESNIASVQVDAVNHFIESKLDVTTKMIANHPEFINKDLAKIKATMQSIEQIDKEVSYFSYVDLEGNSTNSQGQVSNSTDRDYFKEVKATKKAAISDLLISKKTNKYAIILAVPILDQSNALQGMVICVIHTEELAVLSKNLVVEKTGYAMTLSKTFAIINHADQEKVGQNFLELAKGMDQSQFAGDEGYFEYSFDGSKKIASYKTVPATGWKIVVTAPSEEVYDSINHANSLSIWIIVIVALLTLALALFLARATTKPILQTVQAISIIAKGDLTPRLTINRKDELGDLARNVNDMADSFGGIIRQAQQSAERVSGAAANLTAASSQSVASSNHITASIEDIVNGSETQLRSAEQTSKAMEEMTSGIQRIAESAGSVSEETIQSSALVQEGHDSVQKAITQMGTIQNGVQQASVSMRELQAHSRSIGEIVAMITEISGQTSLLSLNASIEAARAGEHGRGFAVVASEIKKLAEQSHSQAERIKDLIKEIQSNITVTAANMERSVVDVEAGAETVVQTGHMLGQIHAAFQEITSQIQEISAATEELSAGTEEVNASMLDIVGINKESFENSQSISAAAEEEMATVESISSDAEQLNRTAAELLQAISRFKL